MSEAIKEAVAGAARSLWMNYRHLGTQGFLFRLSGGSIVHAEACEKIGAYIGPMQFGFMVNVRRKTADAAEWLYHNRGSRIQTLALKSPGAIVGMYEACKAADEAKAVIDSALRYSDKQLRKAYLAGWEASGEGYNGEVGPYDGDSDLEVKIQEALRIIKCES